MILGAPSNSTVLLFKLPGRWEESGKEEHLFCEPAPEKARQGTTELYFEY